MRHKNFTLVVSLLIATCLFVAPASADKGGQGKGGGNSGNGAAHGNNGNHGNSGNHGNGGNGASKGKGPHKFDTSQRSEIQHFYRDSYEGSGHCPPGLAKKDNGCQPPGQAGRNWDAGQTIPPDVELYPIPPALRATLAVPLPGYDYGYVDGGVILFATSGRLVVDFVPAY